MYKVEAWSERGTTSVEEPTKRLANLAALRFRGDSNVKQTNVIFPNGSIRICRNVQSANK